MRERATYLLPFNDFGHVCLLGRAELREVHDGYTLPRERLNVVVGCRRMLRKQMEQTWSRTERKRWQEKHRTGGAHVKIWTFTSCSFGRETRSGQTPLPTTFLTFIATLICSAHLQSLRGKRRLNDHPAQHSHVASQSIKDPHLRHDSSQSAFYSVLSSKCSTTICPSP